MTPDWTLTSEQIAGMSKREFIVRAGYISGMVLDEIAISAKISRDMVTHTACILRRRGIPVPKAAKDSYHGPIKMYHAFGRLDNGCKISCHSQDRDLAIKKLLGQGGTLDA